MNGKYFGGKFVTLRLWIALPLLLIASSFASLASNNVIWLLGKSDLYRIDVSSSTVSKSIPLSQKHENALVDPRTGDVWLIADSSLTKINPDGNALLSLDASTISLKKMDIAVLDAHTGNLWLSDERKLALLSPAGALIQTWDLDNELESMAVSQDGVVWLVTKHYINQLTTNGSIVQMATLPANCESETVVVDDLAKALWLICEHGPAYRYAIDSFIDPPVSITLLQGDGDDEDEWEEAALDPVTGRLWIASDERLLALNKIGGVVYEFSASHFAYNKIKDIAFDLGNQALWVLTRNALYKVHDGIVSLVTVTIPPKPEALGVSAHLITPTLSFLSPDNHSASNDAFLPIELQLDSLCNGVSCDLGPVYFDETSVFLSLNGTDVSPLLTRNGDTAIYSPGVRYPEGQNTVSAYALDPLGHMAGPEDLDFTIDTIAPLFTAVSPLNGAVLSSNEVLLSGITDDPQATVTFLYGGSTLFGSGAGFGFNIILNEGINTFYLNASDAVGNVATLILGYTLDTIPPKDPIREGISLSDNGDGSYTFTGVAGSVEANATVYIRNLRTGEIFQVVADGSGAFSLSVSGQRGDKFAVSSGDAAGNRSGAITKIAGHALVAGRVMGRVVDASTGQGLANVKVVARDFAEEGYTNADGRFALELPSRKGINLFFIRDGYIESRRDTYLRPSGLATVGEVALTAWDNKVVHINAATGGTFIDATGNVEVTFPPGALPNDTDIQGVYLPNRQTFPIDLPVSIPYAGGVQMGPEHIEFNSPVTVRIKNVLGLPAGTVVPYFFASHSLDDPNPSLYDPGDGMVTADGQFIEFQVNHFSCAGLGYPPPPDEPDDDDEDKEDEDDTEDDNDEDDDECKKGSSTVSLCKGNVKLKHQLPSFQAFGRNNAPVLAYDSGTVTPRPYISARINMGALYDPATPPDSVRARLSIEGMEKDIYVSPAGGKIPFHYSWTARNGLDQKLKTGSYPYSLRPTNMFSSSTTSAANNTGGGGSVPANFSYGQTSQIGGRVIVHDRSASPFGAGWGLEELQRIHKNPDGTLLLTQGNGDAKILNPTVGVVSGGRVVVNELATGLPGYTRSVASDGAGNLYVSSAGNSNNSKIYKITPDKTQTVIADNMAYVGGLDVSQSGEIYVANIFGEVYRIVEGSAPVVIATLTGSIDHIDDLAIGPDNNIYVLDGGFGVIHKVTPAGEVSFFYNG
ncbi:MAG: hypothetical protein BMS9Abin36_0805 [Gammaproteobacteria bacterium]|nr:MAG: hypothetical protein BMS9Abin36_0805 [Gammaproteobacteria bacterium]